MNVPEVMVAGELFIDWLMIGIDAWPAPGREIFAKEFRREIGGGTAITACALARLGSECGVMAVIGSDMAVWITERLRGCGVLTSELAIDPAEPSGLTVIASRPEDRAFITYLGANKSFQRTMAERLNSGVPLGRHVHLSFPPSLDTGSGTMAKIRSAGSSVSLDVGWQQTWLADQRAFDLLRQVDIFFPNHPEAERLTGEHDAVAILKQFERTGIRRVALKLGSQGAALLWDGALYFANPHSVTPVDTTGAGDCFDAGFIHAWLRGENAQSCLNWANICGALSTESYGGIAGCPDLERLKSELEKAAA